MAHHAVAEDLLVPPDLGIQQVLTSRYLKSVGRLSWKWIPDSKPLQNALAQLEKIFADSPSSIASDVAQENRKDLMLSAWKQLVIGNALDISTMMQLMAIVKYLSVTVSSSAYYLMVTGTCVTFNRFGIDICAPGFTANKSK